MQSPQKLQQRLDELLGPPDPNAEPLELALRSVVRITAPTIGAMLAQYDAEGLDRALEHVALFFLKIRSDGEGFSLDFLEDLAQLAAAHPDIEPAATPAAPVPEVHESIPEPAALPPRFEPPPEPAAPAASPEPAAAEAAQQSPAPPAPPWG